MEMRMTKEDYKKLMSSDSIELKAKTEDGDIIDVTELIVEAKPEKSAGGGMFG